MRKDLERTGNMLKKIKNPLGKHIFGHHERNEKGKIVKEGVRAIKEQVRPDDKKWHQYVKVNRETGSAQVKSILPNVPKINLPKINMPQISFGGPKPKYFKRRNMMAKNQIIRK